MNQIFAIAQNTFREAVRNRIFAFLIFFALGMLAFALAMSSAFLHEEVRLMKDVGLFLTSTASVFIGIFTGVNLVYKELEKKTIYTIMSKPIYRSQFLMGKYLGLAFTMAVLVAFMGGVLVGLILMKGGQFQISIVQAIWLVYVEVLIVLAIALVFSSFSTPFLSGIMTLGIFLVGRFVDVLSRVDMELIQWITYVVPDLSIYNVTPQVVYDRTIGFDFIREASLVGATYIAIGFVLASVLFGRRDFV